MRSFTPMLVALVALVAGVDQGGPHAQSETGTVLTGNIDAPALRLKDLEGVDHDLGEWLGQVLVVNFWASWCGPCQTEIPELVRMQRDYGEQGLQIIGVGIDRRRPLANVRRSLGINYPVLVADPQRSGPLLARWGNAERFVPYTVVIDRHGRVVHRQFGEMDREVFADLVLPLL